MLDFFRGTLSPDAILDYLHHLPRTSAYQAAVAEDDELAAELAAQPEGKPGAPRLTEFSPEVEALAAAVDRLGTITAVLIKALGGKPGKPKPYPRPETALERARRRARYERHKALAARVLPGRSR